MWTAVNVSWCWSPSRPSRLTHARSTGQLRHAAARDAHLEHAAASSDDASRRPNRRDEAYIRKTPNLVSGIGAWSAASMPRESTRRVSSGSMTPSSHSRAVAKYGEPSRSYVSRIGASKRRASASSCEVAADRREDARRLLAAHHADPGVRPRPEEPRPVGAAGHRVVPGAEAARR